MVLALMGCIASAQAQDSDEKKGSDTIQYYHYTCDCGCHNHPANNYSGLNSLMERLAGSARNGNAGSGRNLNFSMDGRMDSADGAGESQNDGTWSGLAGNANQEDWLAEGNESGQNGSTADGPESRMKEYLSAMSGGETSICAPVYVFFKIGTTQLTDPAQMINIDAIAALAKQWHLKVRVTGAADSATGTSDGNSALSEARAEYIKGILVQSGIGEGMIQILSEGGVNEYTPVSANRNCRIEVFN